MRLDCGRVATEGMAERYMLGRLTRAEVEEFESHYFDCEECFATVEALRAVKCQLEKERERVPELAKRPSPTPRYWFALAAAAAVTATVIVLVVWALGSR